MNSCARKILLFALLHSSFPLQENASTRQMLPTFSYKTVAFSHSLEHGQLKLQHRCQHCVYLF